MTDGPLFAVLLEFVASEFAVENHSLMAVKGTTQATRSFFSQV